MHEDISDKWNPCLVGMPDYMLSILDVYGGFDTSHPFTLMTNFYKPSLATLATSRGMKGAITLKVKTDNCKEVMAGFTDVSSRMMAEFSTTRLMANSMTLLMNSFSNLTSLSTSFFAGDLKTFGKTTGEMFFTLFGSDEIATALE